MTKLGLALLLLTFGVQASELSPNARYIHELDHVLSTLGPRDPTRPQLTERLADALFNEALTLSGQPDPDQKLAIEVQKDRRQSIQIYRDLLTGLNGRFPQPSSINRGKIQFQLARLYSDLGETKLSEGLWTELTRFYAIRDIQREALLRLAEILENRGGRSELGAARTDYQKAIALCTTKDVCSYGHYRLAWVYERLNQLPMAVEEMRLALWDSKNQVREEALRDLVQMMGAGADDGHASLTQMQALSEKIGRPKLIDDLANAYFASGNRIAGAYVLDAVNRQRPTLSASVRLLEEDYGFRNWTKFDSDLMSAQNAQGTPFDSETEKVLRRLSVQLDGERITSPDRAREFKSAVLLYLKLYPATKERTKMIDGWLAVETNDPARISQLGAWITEEHTAGHTGEEIRLRKIRSASAQKIQDEKTVIADMSTLVTLSSQTGDKREAEYQAAYAYYKSKKYADALPRFLALARLPQTGQPDKWALLSEHLALDIYSQQKNLAAVVNQAHIWTQDPRFTDWSKAGGEWADVVKIENSARFEWATTRGKTPDALAVFATDCEAGLFFPKSCENARVLALKLGDEKTLVLALRKLNKKDELAGELEASAQYTSAATLLEQKWKEKPAGIPDCLKVALLYELGNDLKDRDRVLQTLVEKIIKEKNLGSDEAPVFQTLLDADLLTSKLLKVNWSEASRDRLLENLATSQKMTPEIRQILAKSCQSTGPAWDNVALEELQHLDEAQSRIHFSGKGSKSKFVRRMAVMKKLNERGDCYLQGAAHAQRATFATLLAKSNGALAEEIKASPIPADVDDAGRHSLIAALNQLAQPFTDKSQDLENLARVEGEKAIQTKPVVVATTPSPTTPPSEVLRTAVNELHQNPNQREALTNLKNFYQSTGNVRLAAYFLGRLRQLDKSENGVLKQ